MNTKSIAVRAAFPALILATAAASAEPRIAINGFLTAAGSVSDSEVAYLNGITDQASFENDSVLGIQLSGSVVPGLDITAQLLASADDDTYDISADWAFLSYALNDDLKLRAGRIKFPLFLVSDYVEVGYAYPWIRPPQEVYGGLPLNAISGVDALVTRDMGAFDLLVQPYFGSNSEDTEPGGLQMSSDMRDVMGINLSASTEVLTVRAGYMESKITSRLTAPAPLPPGVDIALNDDQARFFGVGAMLDWNDFVVYSEYTDTSIAKSFPDSTAWYVTVGHRHGKFLPHVTVAERDTDEATPLARKQRSTTLGLRYDLNTSTALKAEWQRAEALDGTAGLFDAPPGEDVNVFSFAVDVVF